MAGAGAAPINIGNQEQLLQAFKKYDSNNDGRIQFDEFNRLMMSFGTFSAKEIAKLFQEADIDNSGSLEWTEFVKWIATGQSSEWESFRRIVRIEYVDENAFVESSVLSYQVLNHLKEQERGSQGQAQMRRRLSQRKGGANDKKKAGAPSAPDVAVGDDYRGYRLPVPVTQEGAVGLMQHYLATGESSPLHPKYVKYLTTEFASAYKAKYPTPVIYAETPKPGRLIIVGDTHGQLADVLHIFHQIGPPSAQNRYIFNGDVADRGHQAVEIFMMLFTFFLADPECIIINRGNHENEDMNALDADNGGGFTDEVLLKYGLMAYRRFVTCFKALSLCCVVEKEIFVVHGGLTRVRSLSIDYINSIEFHECTSPHPMSSNVKDQVFSDLLWSDPTDQVGKFKSDRGIGIKFGPDLTTKFCMLNKLRFIVRSHQLPDDGHGYRKQHEGRCVTIFSASNYCGNGGNYGAVLVLNSEHFPRYEIYEHYAAPLEELPRLMGIATPAELGHRAGEQRNKDQEAVTKTRFETELTKMISGIIEKKPSLWAHLLDMGLGNRLPLEAWEEMMVELVDSSYPWKEAAASWELAESDGRVDMAKFLKRWIVLLESSSYASFVTKAVSHVYMNIIALDLDLMKTVEMFDIDGDGAVDLKEFRQVLGMFDLGLTSTQLDRLTGQMFGHIANQRNAQGESSARINVPDFLGQLTVVYKHLDRCSAETGGATLDPWAQQALNQIGRLIIRTPANQLISDLDRAARKIQAVFRGSRARAATSAAKNASPSSPTITEQEIPAPSQHAPARRSTLKGPMVGSTPTSSSSAPGFASTPLDKVATLFGALDISGDGILQIDEFVNGILRLPGINEIVVEGQALTQEKLRQVAMATDASGNGAISYLEFLKAFEPSEQGNQNIADALAEDITTVLYRHRHAIRMGCQYIDEEGAGKIRPEDFGSVLQGVNSALSRTERTLTSMQISLLTEAMTVEDPSYGGDLVDYDFFLRAFLINDTVTGRTVKKH